MTIGGGRIVTPSGIIEDGWVKIADGRIVVVGSGSPGPTPYINLRGEWLLPGFVDLHVHGGGGHDVTSSVEAMAATRDFHRSHGTTRSLLSLVAAPLHVLREQLSWVRELAGAQVVGAHLEGPFLAEKRCGAQNPAYLRMPDRDALRVLLDAARGSLRSMTIAPELPGALDVITELDHEGVVAAIGHSDASYDDAMAGFAAGATLATHLFNGMPRMHHREPGAAGAALVSGAACEVINDGEHVHPAVVRLVDQIPGRLVLVTDAMAAAGMSDGDYMVAGQPVRVTAGLARLASHGNLAGSTLTMDAAVRHAVVDCGLSIEQASAAASTTPARLIGLHETVGQIATGFDADLVIMNTDLQVRRVMARGAWVR